MGHKGQEFCMTNCNYSVVILFCDIEFSRPARDGMLVENDATNDRRPVG
jgi:hypothetical protein